MFVNIFAQTPWKRIYQKMDFVPHQFVELTAISILEDQEDSFRIVKLLMELMDIRVLQIALNLHLASELVMYPILFNVFLEYHL